MSEMSPVAAIGAWMITYAQERADCVEAGECVHGHVNGACPLDDEEDER